PLDENPARREDAGGREVAHLAAERVVPLRAGRRENGPGEPPPLAVRGRGERLGAFRVPSEEPSDPVRREHGVSDGVGREPHVSGKASHIQGVRYVLPRIHTGGETGDEVALLVADGDEE